MLLNQSRHWDQQNFLDFDMRCSVDTILVNQVCRFFKPQTVLEIGFLRGQTLGIIAEAIDFDAKFTSVDIADDYLENVKKFQSLYPELDQKVTYIHQDSTKMCYNESFDFVSIDGDHSYDGAMMDLNTVLPCLHKNSILYMDDITWQGVTDVVKEKLIGQNDLIPFMVGDQGMFFHHISHDVIEFSDAFCQSQCNKFLNFSQIDFHGYEVTKISTLPVMQENKQILRSVLNFYNL